MSACPSCGDDAEVQKVSGLYRARGDGRHDDDLTALLAPPRPEPAPEPDRMDAAPPASSGSLDDPGAIAGYGGVLAVVGGVIGWFWSPDELSPMTYAWVGIMTGLVLGVVVGIVYSALRGAGGAPVTPGSGDSQTDSPEHRQRLDQWEQAAYCRKHDAVILSGESKVLSPPEFRRLMSGEFRGPG